MSVCVLVLLACLQGSAAPENLRPKIAEFVLAKAPRFWAQQKKRDFANEMSERIVAESERRKLDPIAMTAVAWIESDFQPYARGKGNARREGEVGVWQLIPFDTYVNVAWKRLAACKPPKRLSSWLHSHWNRRATTEGAECEDQQVADSRRYYGPFVAMELIETVVSTYVAAYEIRAHIDAAKARGAVIRGAPKSCDGIPDVAEYARYNSPASPQRAYLDRLCRRYKRLNDRFKSANQIASR